MCNNSFEASTCEQGSQMFQHTSIGDSEQRSFNCISSSLDGISHNLNVDLRVATEIKQFYAWVRSVKLSSGIDLNAFDWENRHASSACVVSPPSTCTEPRTPWELGYSWAINEGNISTTLENLYRVRDDEWPFIRHMTPKYISVSARAASSQLLGKSEIEMDLFDAIIRRIKQDDDVLYSSVANLRWRHFFESDLMALITAGALDLTESKLREQLVGSYIPYDLTKCKLLFFPTLLQLRWVCYAWRLHDNVISVFDPSYGVPVPDSRVDTHERVCYMPKIAMHTVVGKMFHGWQYAWTSAAMRILSWSDTALAGWNRTGLLCSLFCCCFDGVDLNPKLESVDFDAIASKLTTDIVQLKGNEKSCLQFGHLWLQVSP